MTKAAALVIDDEPAIRELLEITLNRMDIHCVAAPDLATARRCLKDEDFDLCLTDMRLPDGDGVEFVAYMQDRYPRIPVAVITAHGNMETAIQALKSGAFDFLTKPVDLTLLRVLVESALNVSREDIAPRRDLIGTSNAIIELQRTIAKLAVSQVPVYISGESGVGKELVARMIHEQGPRAAGLFVPVNCGAIPPELMESEFFGHRKGSFTGADSDKQGLFQAAEGGTLFLDEVAELPKHMQVKLLRAIQEKKIRPIGEQHEISVNIRLLSATHKNLSDLVISGQFRQDLYYRINVIEAHVCALRERREDIPLLIAHILAGLSEQSGKSDLTIADDAIHALGDYPFPGNIRELENILERAVTLCDGTEISARDLDLPNIAKNDVAYDPRGGVSLDEHLMQIEKKLINKALEKHRWNKTATARALGISFRALRYRLKKLELE